MKMAAEAYQRDGKLAGLATHLDDLDAKLGGLRQPPIPIESIPIIDDDLPQTLAAAAAASSGQQPPIVDTNSIAAALIANLKPEPLENLQEVYSDNGKMTGGATSAAPLSTC